jgi:hypothetical protein
MLFENDAFLLVAAIFYVLLKDIVLIQALRAAASEALSLTFDVQPCRDKIPSILKFSMSLSFCFRHTSQRASVVFGLSHWPRQPRQG